jgi:hypothetical protein
VMLQCMSGDEPWAVVSTCAWNRICFFAANERCCTSLSVPEAVACRSQLICWLFVLSVEIERCQSLEHSVVALFLGGCC